jgi:hypothetical protein
MLNPSSSERGWVLDKSSNQNLPSHGNTQSHFLGGAESEKIWDLANRRNVWFGAGLRQRGREESPCQISGPPGNR